MFTNHQIQIPYERSLLNELENQVSLIQSGCRRVNVNNDTKCVCVCTSKRTRNMLISQQSLNFFCSLDHIHESFEWDEQKRCMKNSSGLPFAHFIYRKEHDDVISFNLPNRHIEANTSWRPTKCKRKTFVVKMRNTEMKSAYSARNKVCFVNAKKKTRRNK